MSPDAVRFTCHGCGAAVDPARALPFRCPEAGSPGDDTDHVLVPDEVRGEFPAGLEQDPFLRYRTLLSPYRLARSAGLSDGAWVDIAGHLDQALVSVDGRGFRITPMSAAPSLARAAGLGGELWAKDETGNVAGSHKARHLMGVMLYLRVLEVAGLPAGKGLRERRLAIASCGNAALAAAVIARAADWPLDVFIPPAASPSVVGRLRDLGSSITVCERRPGEAGDPCYLRFAEAVEGGAVPFGVQGPANGLAVEGGRTLAFEMAGWFREAGVAPGWIFVQVGGGALASGLAQGFAIATAQGVLPRLPRLVAVQTAACAPIVRAWNRAAGVPLPAAALARSRFMWPWEGAPTSIADGILDDETYDWWAVVEGMRRSGGHPVLVGEDALARARDLARVHARVAASATGTSGLAGVIASPPPGADGVVVILSGAARG
jgi:threonine synthase